MNSLKRASSNQAPKKGIIACLESAQALNPFSKTTAREKRTVCHSPKNELGNMSSGVMPGSWDTESPSTTKTHEDYERDIEARKGTTQQETPQFCLVEDILQGLSELNENKEIAEEKTNKFTKKVMNMEQRLSSHMALASKVQKLAEENRSPALPYRKDLTPAEFRQDYDALIEQIQDWVQKLMNPWMEDCDDDAHAFLIHAKRRIADADRFERTLR
ncbi:hypothetical protein FBULB1_9944 [Fusarium bulbicola]|nr:hypothetical protein FBULB1_9944 [Fusarium bulbicola]